MNYYQVQLLLLVTYFEICEFILHSPKGPPPIQEIGRDEQLISKLRHSLSTLWYIVLAPEIFEMRVSRNLHPFIL